MLFKVSLTSKNSLSVWLTWLEKIEFMYFLCIAGNSSHELYTTVTWTTIL